MSNAYYDAQADELSACEAIFGSDMTILTPCSIDGPSPALSLLVRPHTDDVNHVGITLGITYTPHYPDTALLLELREPVGLTSSQVDQLKSVCDAVSTSTLGSPMLFALVEVVREWLRSHNEPAGDGSSYDEMMKRRRDLNRAATAVAVQVEKRASSAVQVDAADLKRREGTPVSRETFAAWRVKFDAEFRSTTVAASTSTAERRSGRAMFESDASLATSDMGSSEEVEVTPAAAATDGSSSAAGYTYAFAMDASLFEGGEPDDEEEDEEDEDYEDEEESEEEGEGED